MINFFSLDNYIEGPDYSNEESCIVSFLKYSHPKEIYHIEETDEDLSDIVKEGRDGKKYKFIIEQKLETQQEKRERVKQTLLNATDEELSTELLEGEEIKGAELGELLNKKMLGGNIYKELQLHREILNMFLPFLLSSYGNKLTEEQQIKLQSIKQLNEKVKTLLSFF